MHAVNIQEGVGRVLECLGSGLPREQNRGGGREQETASSELGGVESRTSRTPDNHPKCLSAEILNSDKTCPKSAQTQVYEYMSGNRQFRSIPEAFQRLRIPQFALVPSTSFLCLLSNSPETINAGIRLSTSDGALFKQLSGRLGDVVDAVKSLRPKKKIGKPEKGKRKAVTVQAGSDEEESDFPEALGTS
ncbi:hypothetical protein B0H17DRAFT_1189507 [Mycena rosella]|uniref:Uncharacterized protein n=1 Tax=Mycena rosella TaxID=1033263 RepID=A0AAD7F732_MYCRO|nr:hypothetical protein B0H17DRAFT_1189507 [Mycena rosella]